jgi:hypothetical protein
MSEYTTYDLSETLDRVSIDRDDIEEVVAAWGDTSEGWGAWEGAFILRLKDGRYAHVWGWCDTSGWGCQDGAEVSWFDSDPGREVLRGTPQWFMGYLEALSGPQPEKWQRDWDETPSDLNRYVRGEIPA